jgi:hypothetical protein
MSTSGRKAEQFFEFVATLAVLALIGWGVWQARKYVRHEWKEGSATNQLRRISEEAQKAGWIKGSNGAWSFPENFVTNTTGSQQVSRETNNAVSGEK